MHIRMYSSLPINYAADSYGYVYGVAKINGMSYILAKMNTENRHLHEIAMDHSIMMNKMYDKIISNLSDPIFIYSDSIGGSDPLTWAGSTVFVSNSEALDIHEDKPISSETVYKAFESNTILEIKSIAFAIAKLSTLGYLKSKFKIRPIVIRSTNKKVIELLTPDNIIKAVIDQWQSGALPIVEQYAIREFILNANESLVTVFQTPLRPNCGLRKILKSHKPNKFTSDSAVYVDHI